MVYYIWGCVICHCCKCCKVHWAQPNQLLRADDGNSDLYRLTSVLCISRLGTLVTLPIYDFHRPEQELGSGFEMVVEDQPSELCC